MKEPLPNWVDEVMQGLVYWVGYKQQLYRNYPIREGELVGEALSLLSSKVEKDMRINAEVAYEKLCGKWNKKERADIVISTKSDKFEYKKNVKIVIEVKRKEAPLKEVEKDFIKLAKLKNKNEKIRCFLLYVSPNVRPKDYVTDAGAASKGEVPIKNGFGFVGQVRKVKKASDRFFTIVEGRKVHNAIEKSHFVCLVEVGKN